MTWWDSMLGWLASWNASQGFWTFVQGVGTALAAVAAVIAAWIAMSQLKALTKSNKLLADSNDEMTKSNMALTRPYVVVDFEFRPNLMRRGGIADVSLALRIENAGRTPAKNLRLKSDHPFPVRDGREDEIAALNSVLDGSTVIKTLTSVRPISYFVDDSDALGTADRPADSWTIEASYEDEAGNLFHESTTLELSHWRLSLVNADPLQRIAKNVEGVTYAISELKNTKGLRGH